MLNDKLQCFLPLDSYQLTRFLAELTTFFLHFWNKCNKTLYNNNNCFFLLILQSLVSFTRSVCYITNDTTRWSSFQNVDYWKAKSLLT